MVTMAITRVGMPPTKGPIVPFIRRVDSNGVVKGILLCEDVFAIYTHWVGALEATLPCRSTRATTGEVLDDTDCTWCQKAVGERWRGFLHFWNSQKEKEEFLEVTQLAWQGAKGLNPGIPSLRGYNVEARRGNGNKSRLTVRVWWPEIPHDPDRLPKEKSPVEALEKTMKT
jgi:hypothetical protein